MTANAGVDCKLYRNSGTWASPTWVEVDNIRDLQKPASWETAQFKTRGVRSVRNRKTHKTETINFTMEWEPDVTANNANWAAFNTAFRGASSVIELLILNGPIGTNGSKGIRGVFEVTKFDDQEPLGDAQTFDVECVPAVADGGNAVQEYTVSV